MSLLIWNRWRWYCRLPLKTAVFAFTYLIVCFPYPGRLLRHIRHWRNPEALIDPTDPGVQRMADEVRSHLPEPTSVQRTIATTEAVVYEMVPYDWDWNTWGVADYLPTVREVLEKGKEDCDGRAVVAASVLRALGIQANLVGSLTHIWVKTPYGETMWPQKDKIVEVTPRGMTVRPKGLLALPKATLYGMSVFPLARELIILGVLWVLLLDEAVPWRRRGIGLVLLVVGLLVLRKGADPIRIHARAVIVGSALWAAAAWALLRGTRRSRNAFIASSAPTGVSSSSNTPAGEER